MNTLNQLIHHPKTLTLTYLVLLALVSGLVLGSFVSVRLDGYERAMLQNSIDGTAYRPFVYRALVPFVTRRLTDLVPAALREQINDAGRALFTNETLRRKIPIGRVDYTSLAILGVLWYSSLLGFAWAFTRFLSTFYQFPRPFIYAVSLVGVAGIPAFFASYNYIYDLPHIFLFTLSLVLLSRQRWPAYLVLFALTTLNKETSVLLILAYCLYYHNKLGRRFWRLLAGQMGMFLAIKLYLTALFGSRPGSVVEFHLRQNLFLANYNIAQFTAFVIILVAVAYDWQNKPEFVRQALWLLVPLLGLTFFFGVLQEYRDYYEVYPVLLMLCAHTVARVLGLSVTLRVPAASSAVYLPERH